MSKVLLGYEVGTAHSVYFQPSHLIVTGITQQSGKTTTLEALIKRSGFKAIVFKTKPGEKSFSEGNQLPAFFKDRSDYEFVRSLIEAYNKEKLSFEKGILMTVCKGSRSLIDIKKRVDDEIATGKLRGLKEEIYTRLEHYLASIIPQIQYTGLSATLGVLTEGVNIMDLGRFSDEAQSLIIQATADEVLKNRTDVIIVIPEAWKFLPQKYNNPCKRVVESYIRQGAANRNYIWLDSQDMAGVDKIPLKQISTWILGYQTERNEVKHTLDQIPSPKKSKPKEDDIQNLKIGHFFFATRDIVVKVYVQPAWMEADEAIQISIGKKQVEDVHKKITPITLKPFALQTIEEMDGGMPGSAAMGFNKVLSNSTVVGRVSETELVQLRHAFFTKLLEVRNEFIGIVNNLYKEWATFHQQALAGGLNTPVDEDKLLGKLMEMMKLPTLDVAKPGLPVEFNIDEIVKKVLAKIPAGSGTYTVSPLDAIKKKFLQEIRERIIKDVASLSDDQKKALLYLETRDIDITPSEVVTQCFLLKIGGSSSTKISNILKALLTTEVAEKTSGNRYRKGLRKRITGLMGSHQASEAEIDGVYNHILSDILGSSK